MEIKIIVSNIISHDLEALLNHEDKSKTEKIKAATQE